LQIQLFVCFANGLAPARHKYVSTERSIFVVNTGTSLELALENSPSFRRTSIPHHTATVAENSRNIRHVNYAHLYAKIEMLALGITFLCPIHTVSPQSTEREFDLCFTAHLQCRQCNKNQDQLDATNNSIY
jgi:hypothetical protein